MQRYFKASEHLWKDVVGTESAVNENHPKSNSTRGF